MQVSTGSGSDRVADRKIEIEKVATRSLPLPVLTSLFAEINLRRLSRSFFGLEVRLFFEAHQTGNQHRRKAAARRIVILGRLSVIVARSCQTVFSSGQFIL